MSLLSESRSQFDHRANAMRELPPPEFMSDEDLEAELAALLAHEAGLTKRWECPRPGCDGEPHPGWLHRHARAKQRMPESAWWLWLILTGRGWGKTRTASETVKRWVLEEPGVQVAVVARKMSLVRSVCFEALRAGLLAVIPEEEVESYTKGTDVVTLRLKNGSAIYGFSAQVPDNFRGQAFDKVWCDEYAAWSVLTAQESWDVLTFCLRESSNPQRIVTTTPRGNKHLKALLRQAQDGLQSAPDDDGAEGSTAGRRAVLTTGSMLENAANLHADFITEAQQAYDGTRMGSQEIEGLVLDDVEGALWKASMFDYRKDIEFRIPTNAVPPMDRVVVAVDPATTAKDTSDNTGFTVAGRSSVQSVSWEDGLPHAFVQLAEEQRLTPRAAMQRAIDLYHAYRADAIVVEANNGGEYLRTVAHMIDPAVNVEIVYATRGKRARAAPVAALYEREKVHHVGQASKFRTLEDQQTTFVGLGDKVEDSPDLLDSLVWAITDLLVNRQMQEIHDVQDTRRRRR